MEQPIVNRREFIWLSTEGLAAASLLGCSRSVENATGMPRRILGKTGLRVSILAFGTQKMSSLNRQALQDRVVYLAGPHALCWARADYYDGQVC